MLSDTEVLDQPDTYTGWRRHTKFPTPRTSTSRPTSKALIPITRMVPRSFITNLRPGTTLASHRLEQIRGIACGVKSVDISSDGGKSWRPAQLGNDQGQYSFRQWQAQVALPSAGQYALMVRCTNSRGEAQPMAAN
jgi:hypothetical protein